MVKIQLYLLKQLFAELNEKKDNLIWIDLEMTGLDTENDKIIEIAVIVTDKDLSVIKESKSIAIHQDKVILDKMDEWNKKTHKKTGLIDRVLASDHNEKDAENYILNFLSDVCYANSSPMCGNSICQDRRFLFKSMPNLEKFFHYRNLDVSSFKEVFKRWSPEKLKNFEKKGRHTAIEDIKESIDELKFYRQEFFNF